MMKVTSLSTLKSVSLSSIGSVAKAHAEDPKDHTALATLARVRLFKSGVHAWYRRAVWSTYRPNALVGFAAAEVALVAGALAPLFGWLRRGLDYGRPSL